VEQITEKSIMHIGVDVHNNSEVNRLVLSLFRRLFKLPKRLPAVEKVPAFCRVKVNKGVL